MFNKIKSLFSNTQKNNTITLSIKNLDDIKYFSVAKKIFECFENQNKNYELQLVGGCVRKLISGEKIDDMDIAINIEPANVKKILIEKKIQFFETGIQHGTITAIIDNFKFEITSLRKDISTDGRHAKIEFTTDWLEDANRRDFTVNAIYSNLRGEVYDPLGGLNDLKNGIIKFIGDPDKRIKEDYLRILRYLRFYTQYSNHQHNNESVIAINKNLDGITKISKERIIDEFFKILTLNNFVDLFKDKFSSTIIKTIFPQLKYYDRLFKVKSSTHRIINKLNIPLILSILLIDNSDNCEFFLYKYNLSNKHKSKILFLLNKYKTFNFKELLNKKLLIKLAYLNTISEIIDLLIFSFFLFKEINIETVEKNIHFLNGLELPVFPITGDYLKSNYAFSENKKLGLALKKLEQSWIDNDFVIDKKKIKKILNLN